MDKTEWTLSELAAELGLTPRTIRYYISRGLVDGPRGAGRGASYDARHLARLREIQQLQSEGRMLAEVAQRAGRSDDLPTPEAWWRYPVAEGVVIEVRADLAPWRLKHIHRVISEAAKALKQEDRDDAEHGI
ncbi:MAG: helix-turn-helix domain-containing protein [Capsulimonas sp.]|uniref:helix-turn-helix domain-containing protein n=1 Tax=Capsulimonas sp. TaxID=2494211 RepID=UPI0032661703